MSINSDQLLDNYHSGDFPYSFGGKKNIKDFINISNNDLNKTLSQSDTYTEFKEFRSPKFTPPIRTYAENYLWEADLMFFTHPDFVQANEGNLYVIAVIDTFTKLALIRKLKSKSGATVTAAVKQLFNNVDIPKYLRVDAGGEFVNREFMKMCKDHDVKMYLAMEPIKCSMVERFNRTFKRILVQLMEQNNSIRWIDFIETAIEIYNTRQHRSIGMSPEEASNKRNQKKILRQNLKRYANYDKKKVLKNKTKSKYRLNQFVKIFRKKGIFSRGFHQNVTKEYFRIYHIDRNLSKDRYYLKDIQGDKIIGSFYEEYLVPYIPPKDEATYRLDPSFQGYKLKNIRGVSHIFVKWLGWPHKFNQWIPLDDVRSLLPSNLDLEGIE